MNNNQKSSYCFDISLTDDCNFRCSYCVERDYQNPIYLNETNMERACETIQALLDTQYFQKDLNVEELRICFWGGEPTLHFNAIKKIVHAFDHIDLDIAFSTSSNGYNITDEMMDFILEVNSKPRRQFNLQISYDGNPMHDLCRKTRCGKETAEVVKQTIRRLIDKKIFPSLKSTATFIHFDKLYDSYLDIANLADETDHPFVHALTLDYSYQTLTSLPDEVFEQSLINLKKNLALIARNEVKRIVIDKKPPVFQWFDKSDNVRRLCSAGNRYQVIDHDGSMYTCHGCVYVPEKQEHYLCSIHDTIEHVVEKLKYINDLMIDVSNKDKLDCCPDCDASVCYICNATRFSQSQKETYFEKWTDFKCEPKICRMYHIASAIREAKLIKEEETAVKLLQLNKKE